MMYKNSFYFTLMFQSLKYNTVLRRNTNTPTQQKGQTIHHIHHVHE